MEPRNTRFAPSPTGHLHIGSARTALFAFVLARQSGGKFLVRIEDTDRARHDEQAVGLIGEDLRWLGLDWDEGIDVGGPAGPYRQSERLDLYQQQIQKLLDEGKAYYAFETQEELEALRSEARARKQDFRYRRGQEVPTRQEAQDAKAQGRPVVVRFDAGHEAVTVCDDVFGRVTTPPEAMDDFVIRKADGFPTFYLANVVDDELMGVNYITRGQEFLGQTWRQSVLRRALGYSEPGYAHLPLIMDMQGRKLSKRDGAVDVGAFRDQGYLPEALLNFVSLLGWNPGQDREKFTLEELVELFSVERIGKSNAKFDRDKLLAFNTEALSSASPGRLVEAFSDFLQRQPSDLPADDPELLGRVLECNRGFRTFGELLEKVNVLFGPNDAYAFDEKAVKKNLRKNEEQGLKVLAELETILGQTEFSTAALEEAIQEYCNRNELGMGKVAQPLRVALTGRTVSPPIAETLLFVGRENVLARIRRCLATVGD
jgi:glutamyl-tRNA synthetase